MGVTIYHNPRCSKSRQALELLRKNGVDLEIIEYLKNPPDLAVMDHILTLLDKKPQDVMRKGEAPYKELGLDDPAKTRAELVEAMVDNPILIERPIVVKDGKKAALGRPPEQVLTIL